MADHLDSPGLTSPAMDASVDITDLYAFQKPGDPSRSVLILNVNPLAPTHATEFRHSARYEILVDTDADALADISFRFRFTTREEGGQRANVKRIDLATGDGHHDRDDRDDHEDGDAEEIIENAPVSFGSTPVITRQGRYSFFAGLRSDPFFFDLAGFLHGFAFTGDDFFKALNVFSIVLELPNFALGNQSHIGVWARTLIPATLQPHRLVQVDQMGRPAINTVFNHGNDKNTFNMTQPSQMRALFLASFVTTLESFGHSALEATAIADILLQDILTFDYSSSSGFLNGRRLQDDVIDAELNLVSKGAVTTDLVGPHTDYLAAFPYVGTPH